MKCRPLRSASTPPYAREAPDVTGTSQSRSRRASRRTQGTLACRRGNVDPTRERAQPGRRLASGLVAGRVAVPGADSTSAVQTEHGSAIGENESGMPSTVSIVTVSTGPIRSVRSAPLRCGISHWRAKNVSRRVRTWASGRDCVPSSARRSRREQGAGPAGSSRRLATTLPHPGVRTPGFRPRRACRARAGCAARSLAD